MAEAPQGKLYSQLAAEDLASQVLRIPGMHNSFATDFLGHTELGEHPPCVRLEALRNRETNTWQIVRVTLPSSDENGPVQREAEVRSGICFFDALHYCARFQMAEEAFGKRSIVVAGNSPGPITHYRVAAESAGQAIDVDGNVHPCSYGSILTPGLFSREAHAVAERAVATELSEMPAVLQTGFVAEISRDLARKSVTLVPHDVLLAKVQDKNTLITNIAGVSRSGDDLMELFKEAWLQRRFQIISVGHGYLCRKFDVPAPPSPTKASVAVGLVSLGLVPLYRHLHRNTAPVQNCAPVFLQKLTDRLEGLNKHVSLLPDGKVKSLCSEFSKAAAYCFRMEYAVAAYREFQSENCSSYLDIGLNVVEEAGEMINLGEADIACAKTLYLNGDMKVGQFWETLVNAWDGDGGRQQQRYEEAMEEFKEGETTEKPVPPFYPLKRTLHDQIQYLRKS